jgi:hypothetical protein
MSKVYVEARKRVQNEQDIVFHYYLNPNNHKEIYDKMMEITDSDHEISAEASSWCELATIGEIYEFREGYLTIVDID